MATSLELAITAIRSNRKEEGRQLLNLLIQQNPNNEMAWMWMSSVVNTDEQRARCLYHVLAINPDNQIARRGLQLLGIVVSDSRPVKVPRDSRPIQIPKPTPPQSQFLPEIQAAPAPVAERRPFRLDPQAVVAELPFTPVTKPFSETPPPASPTATKPLDSQPLPPPKPAESTPVAQPVAPPVPPTGNPIGQPINPSEPTPVVQPNMAASGPVAPSQPVTGTPDSGPVPVVGAPYYPAQPAYPAPSFGAGMAPLTDTRPSQPVPVIAPNPSQPVPVVHSNVTMGMPMYAPGYSPQVSPAHANATLGMPAPAYPGGVNAPLPHPSEPVPVVHSNTTMGMPIYAQPQFQPAFAAQPMYSNSTMAMPVGVNPFAMPTAPGFDSSFRPSNNIKGKKKSANDEEGEEEINVLAVIIFGSLSVTALGGLGMLILLMFAT